MTTTNPLFRSGFVLKVDRGSRRRTRPRLDLFFSLSLPRVQLPAVPAWASPPRCFVGAPKSTRVGFPEARMPLIGFLKERTEFSSPILARGVKGCFAFEGGQRGALGPLGPQGLPFYSEAADRRHWDSDIGSKHPAGGIWPGGAWSESLARTCVLVGADLSNRQIDR